MSSEDGENPADLEEMLDEEPIISTATERRLFTQPLDLSVQTLCDQWKEGLLVLPDIQREYVWDNGKSSRLIESLLLNIPIPVLYFAETDDARYEIFDGHQRTRSIVRYMNNEFSLLGLAVLREHKGKRFHELPTRDQRFLRMRTMRVILISSDSHPNMKFEIYERLNTGSILLNAQELRNSIYRGAFNNLLHELVRNPAFRALMGSRVPRPRMVDEEMVLRFFAMRAGLLKYRPSLKRFLNEYAEAGRSFGADDIASLRSDFMRTIGHINAMLGSAAFRVLDKDGNRTEPTVNRALFEAQMLAFSWIKQPPVEAFRIDNDGGTQFHPARNEIAKLFAVDAFMDAIQRATGDRSRTLRRVNDSVDALRRAMLEVHVPFELNA